MSKVLEAQAIREVCDRDELRLLELVGRGKSLRTIAQLYRQYEGENGVQEALDRIQAKIKRRVAGEPEPGAQLLDERPLEDAISDLADGVDVHHVAAESVGRLNGAGGAAAPPTVAPPAPRPGPTPRSSPPAKASPATANGGSRMVKDRKAREDRAVEFVKRNGPSGTMAIGRGADIAKGSISSYLQRLCKEGRLERVDGLFQIPGVTSGRKALPQPQETPRSPSRPAAAPPPPFAGHKSAQGAPADGVAAWLQGLDRDGLGAAINSLRERLAAYEEFAAALDRVAELVPAV